MKMVTILTNHDGKVTLKFEYQWIIIIWWYLGYKHAINFSETLPYHCAAAVSQILTRAGAPLHSHWLATHRVTAPPEMHPLKMFEILGHPHFKQLHGHKIPGQDLIQRHMAGLPKYMINYQFDAHLVQQVIKICSTKMEWNISWPIAVYINYGVREIIFSVTSEITFWKIWLTLFKFQNQTFHVRHFH